MAIRGRSWNDDHPESEETPNQEYEYVLPVSESGDADADETADGS